MPATAYAPVILRPDWYEGYCPMWARKFVAGTAALLEMALIKDLGL